MVTATLKNNSLNTYNLKVGDTYMTDFSNHKLLRGETIETTITKIDENGFFYKGKFEKGKEHIMGYTSFKEFNASLL